MGSKGYYNASDLNRVGMAALYLSKRLAEQGYAVPVSCRTDWDRLNIPTKRALENYLQDVKHLQAVLALPDGTPALPENMDFLETGGANSIEKNLVALDYVLGLLPKGTVYSGEFESGEGF